MVTFTTYLFCAFWKHELAQAQHATCTLNHQTSQCTLTEEHTSTEATSHSKPPKEGETCGASRETGTDCQGC